MRKILNLSIVVLFLFTWLYHLNSDIKSQDIANEYYNTGNRFFEQEVYEEAIKNYKLAKKYNENIEIDNKIIDSYIQLEKYDNVFTYLTTNKLDKDYIASIQKQLLNILLKNKNHKKYNQYIDKVLLEVSREFKNKNIAKFIELKNQYTDVNYIPQDKKLFIVKTTDKENSWALVNDKSKIFTVSKFDKILGVNDTNITVQEDGYTKIFDKTAKLKSKLNGLYYYKYSEGYYILRENNRFKYVDRAGTENKEVYKYASNFNDGKAVVCREVCSLIDSNFNEIKKFEYSEVKSDTRNDAIHGEMIIFKKENKYLIYDIKNKKISQEYDDIDYSMGENIAVKNNNKWVYIDKEFNLISGKKYDEASSFSNGIAIVKQDGEYKIIDKEENIKHESKYKILSFNSDGISFINKDGKWKMIRLVRHIND